MRTKAYTTALVLFDEVELLDIAGLAQVLSAAGRQWNFRPFKLFTVAERRGPITTREQITVNAAHSFADCETPEIILVPGGYGARRNADAGAALDYLSRVAPSATLLGCIGYGTLLLGAAGLLSNREVAATPETAAILSPLDTSILLDIDAHVLESGNVLSAARSADSLELGLRIVSKFLGKKQADGVASLLGCPWALEPLAMNLLVSNPTK